MNFNICDKVIPKQYKNTKGKYLMNGILSLYLGKQE